MPNHSLIFALKYALEWHCLGARFKSKWRLFILPQVLLWESGASHHDTGPSVGDLSTHWVAAALWGLEICGLSYEVYMPSIFYLRLNVLHKKGHKLKPNNQWWLSQVFIRTKSARPVWFRTCDPTKLRWADNRCSTLSIVSMMEESWRGAGHSCSPTILYVILLLRASLWCLVNHWLSTNTTPSPTPRELPARH